MVIVNLFLGCWPGPLNECPTCALNDDTDGDGFTPNEGDCNDDNPDISPGVDEVCNNGIDDDCDGTAGPCARTGVRELNEADAVITGTTLLGGLGLTVAAIPDVNGDGRDEVLVGSPGWTIGLLVGAGAVFRLDGRKEWFDSEIEAVAPRPIFGTGATGFLGNQIAVSPSLFAIREAPAFTNLGIVYLIDPQFADQPADDGIPGNALTGEEGEFLGGQLAMGPNGELLLSSNLAGRAAWWLPEPPPNGGSITKTNAIEITGDFPPTALAVADFNHDGSLDLALGIPTNNLASSDRGSVNVFFGPITESVDIADADVQLLGEVAGDRVGHTLTVLPDLNGDGFIDLGIGAPLGEGNLAWIVGDLGPDDTELDAASWMRLVGPRDAEFGRAFAAMDVDQDGSWDLAVSAPGESRSATQDGVIYVLNGPLTNGLKDMELADLQLVGTGNQYNAGAALASADVNGDGFKDLVVGAPGDDTRNVDGGGVHIWLSRGI